MKTILKALVCTVALLMTTTSLSHALDIETKGEIESLKKRIERLESKPAEENRLSIASLNKRLTFWGLVEVEAFYHKTESQPEVSDIILATAQLGTDIHISDYMGGHIVFLYEEDETPLDVDEANITMYCPRKFGGGTSGLIAGKLYLPFGKFNTHMITDPLTLDLAETNNTALIFNWKNEKITTNFGFFNGDTDENGDSDNIDSFVASIDVTPKEGITFGFSFLSDLAESDIGLVSIPANYESDVPATAAYISLVFGDLILDGEIVQAMDEFNQAVIDPNGDLSGDKPKALNLEAAISLTDKLEAAGRFEITDDFRGDISRYGCTVSYGIIDGAITALEYLITDPEGGGDMSHTLTAQLAFEF